MVTTANQRGTTISRGTAGRAEHSEYCEPPERSRVSSAVLAQMLANLRYRTHSHPGGPATRFYWMSDGEWRACIDELRRRGHQITEPIVARGDRGQRDRVHPLLRATTSRPKAARPAAPAGAAVSAVALIHRPARPPGNLATSTR